MLVSWIQNIPFYYIIQNFSLFYVCSIVVSVAAVFTTWYFAGNRQVLQLQTDTSKLSPGSISGSETGDIDCAFHVMAKMKRAQQKAIEKILTEQLSEEQLLLEKEIENKQLSEIFKLLREQEEKFRINSEEELHEQLKLYKNQ